MKTSPTKTSPSREQPRIGGATRWTLRGLAWAAFGLAGYLAWQAVNHGTPAGCGGAGAAAIDCHAVFNSPWAYWLGMPVALVGLGLYSTLAALSVLLGVTHPLVSRWVGTLFLALTTIAAGAGVWFVGVQLTVLAKICPYCMALHLCGFSLAGLTWFAALRQGAARQPAGAGVAALRSTLHARRPAGASMASAANGAWRPRWAVVGAGLALATLVVGQVWFPAKMFHQQTVELDQPIGLVGPTTSEPPPDALAAEDAQPAGQPHTARRVSPTAEEAADSFVDPSAEQPASSAAVNGGAGSDAAQAVDELFASSGPIDGAAAGDDSRPVAGAGGAPRLDAEPDGSAPRQERLVRFLGGKLTLNVYEYPVLGSPEAPHVIIEMVAYDCTHCRKMHSIMKEGMRRYGDQLAVIVLPVPLEPACNPNAVDPTGEHRGACATARLALGVALQSPRAFATFHDWLMQGEKVPPLSMAMEKAYTLVDRDRLRAYVRSDEANERLAQCVELFAALQRQNRATNRNFGLPVQIFGSEVMAGAAEAEDVFRAWEETLELAR